ncbi:MAG: DUF2911 domain-containing protein [Flavobacteriales bacterium]|nr:DUF2911 domain-containing protein [Flavobacteriales bacterium]
MKKLSSIILGFLIIGTMSSFAQEKKKSPAVEIGGKIGKSEITINYSSPSVRDREVYGGLEPWGKVWRAGANEATTIEFSTDVTINGKELAKGKYAFFVTPMESGAWSLIFNTVSKQWGAYKYDKSKDALVVEAKPSKIDHTEALTYTIKGNTISLDWATTRVSFEVK